MGFRLRRHVTCLQHLSSSGYVFSASLPPYLPTAAITAIDVLEENPDLITKLNKNIVILCQGLSNIHGLKIVSDVKSPIVFLGLKNSTGSLKSDSQLLEHIAKQKNRVFHITTLIVLKQESTSDSCQTLNEEEIFEVQDKYSLFPFGWIHVSVTVA
ncbi:long chain base biosynthesis protein 1-like [Camellia sinensis]|uniref:long chain base biosynthesis protein 1-like n=1 Tax=Camellia sinensis TaxID=4442 RepID=UPI0010362A20|nr:long chain base biosynthesis protein 1-like [Camellia sinensis]